MIEKPALILITPELPRQSGSGRSLRGWAWLSELSKDYRVHVMVAAPGREAVPADYPAASVRFVAASLSPAARWKRRASLLLPFLAVRKGFATDWLQLSDNRSVEWVRQVNPDRIVVFRLFLYDVAQAVRELLPKVPIDIDFDDLESRTRWSIAACYRRLGRWRSGLREFALALQYRFVEKAMLSQYQTIFLAAPEDVVQLRRYQPGTIACFPNRLAARANVETSKAHRVLFVGSLGYAPNEEAAMVLSTEIATRLAHLDGLKVTIAGRGPSPKLQRRLLENPLVDFVENPHDLAPLYATAVAVLVPLRAGGGTKLKTIEAFAYGRPVVSTEEGVRGLNAVDGEHYLRAESASDFAAAVSRLAADAALAARIAAAGHQLWQRKFAL